MADFAAARASASSGFTARPFLSLGAGSRISMGQGWFSTTGTALPMSFSMAFSSSFSLMSQKEMAVPPWPARPVRPMRWT